MFYDILSCPCPIIMKQLSNPRPRVAPPPHMVSSNRAGPQCRQFSHDDGINYPGPDNLAPAWSQAPPHMNEHRQQTQRHLWECVWSQTSVNPIRHGQAPTISSAEDSWWARNTTWSGACVSWTIPRNTTKSVIYHFSGSLVQDTFTSSRQYGGDVLWLLQFDWCT